MLTCTDTNDVNDVVQVHHELNQFCSSHTLQEVRILWRTRFTSSHPRSSGVPLFLSEPIFPPRTLVHAARSPLSFFTKGVR